MNVFSDDYDWSKHPRLAGGELTCPECEGKGEFVAPPWNGLPESRMPCHDCRATGLLRDFFIKQYGRLSNEVACQHERLEALKEWVKKTSKCSLCGGNAMKTSGGVPCKECTLVGEMPWGG